MTKRVRRKCAVTASLLIFSGCVSIPDDDIAFVDRSIPVGIVASRAEELVKRRGFRPFETVVRPQYKFDRTSQSSKKLPLSDRDIAQQNIGVVYLEGTPIGELSCFLREYDLLIANGDRLICWTVGQDGRITWRQAGFRGASL